jgi:hypothetical protein
MRKRASMSRLLLACLVLMMTGVRANAAPSPAPDSLSIGFDEAVPASPGASAAPGGEAADPEEGSASADDAADVSEAPPPPDPGEANSPVGLQELYHELRAVADRAGAQLTALSNRHRRHPVPAVAVALAEAKLQAAKADKDLADHVKAHPESVPPEVKREEEKKVELERASAAQRAELEKAAESRAALVRQADERRALAAKKAAEGRPVGLHATVGPASESKAPPKRMRVTISVSH